jgi:small subunit ribosomal protein S20
MATHKSALKRHRQDLRRRQQNRLRRGRMRTAVKRYRTALEAGDVEAARGMLSETHALIDRTAKAGAIHVNAADRVKSRLSLALNRVTSAQ